MSLLLIGSLGLIVGCDKTVTNENTNNGVTNRNSNVNLNANESATDTNAAINANVNTNSVANTNTTETIEEDQWQIYVDDVNGFELMYPNIWQTEGKTPNTLWSAKPAGETGSPYVFIYKDERDIEGIRSSHVSDWTETTLSINGVSSYQFTMKENENTKETLIPSGDFFFNFTTDNYDNNIVQDIIMSLKLVDTEWLTYTNDDYGYTLSYPSSATIEQYPEDPKNICITIKTKLGYVQISAPENKGFTIATCGRTGVAYDTQSKSENVTIDAKNYTATGYEEVGPGETLNYHNETLTVNLDDDTRIEYGSQSNDIDTYENYSKTREDVIKIVESFQKK